MRLNVLQSDAGASLSVHLMTVDLSKTSQETAQFDDLYQTMDIDIRRPILDKFSRLHALLGCTLVSLQKLKKLIFRAVLIDDKFITKDIIKYIYSGKLAEQLHT